MSTIELLAYALGAALAATVTVLLLGGAAFGFWLTAWTGRQAAAVGITASLAGILAANTLLARIRCEARRTIG